MQLKPRAESEELKSLRSLNVRMQLADEEKQTLTNLEKGFKGELQFDELLEKKLVNDWFILNDLLLECSKSTFQIDTLLISPETSYIFEIKNYEGDFYIEKDR